MKLSQEWHLMKQQEEKKRSEMEDGIQKKHGELLDQIDD